MTALAIERLHMSYADARSGEDIAAVGDVSFTVEDGEFVAVLGPIGCGKTTVLNIVAGSVKQTGGMVTVAGEPVDGPGPDRGVVSRDHALVPGKTVADNVSSGVWMRKLRRAERVRRCTEMLELAGLVGFGHMYPHELSAGMRQRIGVAQVLANEPAVLLMDEPFASLDAQSRRKLHEDLTRILEKRRPAVLLVTRDVEEAVFLADRVVVLSSRPSHVREIVPVPLARPRHWRAVTGLPEFRETVDRITGLLPGESETL